MSLRLRAELRASRDALCVVLARMWVGAVVLLTGRVAGVAKASKTWVKANVVQPVQENSPAHCSWAHSCASELTCILHPPVNPIPILTLALLPRR